MPRDLPTSRRIFLTGVGALALSGCSSDLIGPPPAGKIYPVSPDTFPTGPTGSLAPIKAALAILRPDAPGGLNTDRIALYQPDGTQDYYADAIYPDRLPAIVQRALLEGFERTGAITVSREQDDVHADLNLLTEVKDFAAHYATQDGVPTVTVAILAKLIKTRGRMIMGNVMPAAHSMSARANTTAAVATAMKQLLGQCVQDIVGATLRQAAAFSARSPAQ